MHVSPSERIADDRIELPEYIFPDIPPVSTGCLFVLDYQCNDGRNE